MYRRLYLRQQISQQDMCPQGTVTMIFLRSQHRMQRSSFGSMLPSCPLRLRLVGGLHPLASHFIAAEHYTNDSAHETEATPFTE